MITAEVKIVIKNMPALQKACRKMGLGLVEKGQCRRYYSTSLDRDYVVELKGPYDVGLTQQPDGSYELDADFQGGHVAKEVGPDCGLLRQKYAEEVVREAARKWGMSVELQEQEDGSILMEVE